MNSLFMITHEYSLPADISVLIWSIICELPITFAHGKDIPRRQWDIAVTKINEFEPGIWNQFIINMNIFIHFDNKKKIYTHITGKKLRLNAIPQPLNQDQLPDFNDENIIYFVAGNDKYLPKSRQMICPIMRECHLGIKIQLV